MKLFDRDARRIRRRERVRLAIEDEFHDLRKWGFADRPSDEDARVRRIGRLVRKFEKLGGDALSIYEVRTSEIAAEAMPDVFEWKPAYPDNGWKTVRIH